jgi:hypothetical protein
MNRIRTLTQTVRWIQERFESYGLADIELIAGIAFY